jgi:hypothetical protein
MAHLVNVLAACYEVRVGLLGDLPLGFGLFRAVQDALDQRVWARCHAWTNRTNGEHALLGVRQQRPAVGCGVQCPAAGLA